MKSIIAMLILSTFLLGGSTSEPIFSAPEYLVTEIEITCSHGFPAHRHYTDQESMNRILSYLRGVELVDTEPVTPPQANESQYWITLTHSTGRVTVYRQIADRGLCKNNSRWHGLDPEQGKLLSSIYRNPDM